MEVSLFQKHEGVFKTISCIVHAVGAVHFTFGCYYDWFEVNIPKEVSPIFAAFGYKLKFLTYWDAVSAPLFIHNLNKIIITIFCYQLRLISVFFLTPHAPQCVSSQNGFKRIRDQCNFQPSEVPFFSFFLTTKTVFNVFAAAASRIFHIGYCQRHPRTKRQAYRRTYEVV